MSDTNSYAPLRPSRMGRVRITSSAPAVTRGNVADLVRRADALHSVNAADCAMLHRYFKGEQSILNRVKYVREEIDNRIVENRADEIVSFKVGYMVGDPVKYVSRPRGESHGDLLEDAEEQAHPVSAVNGIMEDCGKHACDRDVVQWAMVAGRGFRLSLPTGDPDEPLLLRSLSPVATEVVYRNDVAGEPLFSYTTTLDEDARRSFTVYTDNECYYIDPGWHVDGPYPHACGGNPIVEYPNNTERMGCFERVLPLLDAINEVESDRVNGVAQFVQALMVLKNVDLGANAEERAASFDELREKGAVLINDVEGHEAGVELLTSALSQADTQTLVDQLYKTVLRIVGMPSNIGGGASTSDTGVAVTLRDGWSLTETRAKDYELFFKRSERRFMRMAFPIVARTCGVVVEPSDVDINFTRRNYENTQGKAQVYVTLVQNGVPPTLAAEVSGIAPDPEAFGDQVLAWSEAQQAKNAAMVAAEDTGDGDAAAGDGDATPTKKQTQTEEE